MRLTKSSLPLLLIIILSTLFLVGCNSKPQPGSPEHLKIITNKIDDNVLVHADDHPGEWLTHGLNYAEDRYSPLNQIKTSNIGELGLAWSLNLGTKRGLEATPLVVDGIMFLSGPWSLVYAVDARTGKLIWTYNPEVPGQYGEKACCDVVNRGLAMYKGRLFVGTIDGRLVSLDASTGNPLWEVVTVDTTKYYSITGAPRVVDGKVIIGNSGAEYGVRGYVTAYDAMTGEQAWRFYTVPGDPSLPFESPAMEAAAKTWTGEWWKLGGGGTVWDAMAYDPELKLLYIGTGNGSPWVRKYRSPDGGDNLYLSSIVALNPDNGELVWYYQTTPGETWDFTATQHIILADLTIEGQIRKVLMQAPKNGFFYVIDRTNGKLISADPIVYVNWAKGVDLETGRPVENEFSRFEKVNAVVAPNYDGAHNWHSMAFNHQTGLVYIPAMENASVYGADPNWAEHKSGFGVGNGWNAATGFDPTLPTLRDSAITWKIPRSRLIAWDPVAKREVWRVEHRNFWNAGVLTTAGGLVFQGTTDGQLAAYDAADGKKLWESPLGIGVIASPITYTVDNVQYVSIAAGWGGGVGQKFRFTKDVLPGTIFTFTLGGKATPTQYEKQELKELINIEVNATKEEISLGGKLFGTYCALCHPSVGSVGGNIPDLAYSTKETFDNFQTIVRGGARLPMGMPKFDQRLTENDVELIKKYILTKAYEKR